MRRDRLRLAALLVCSLISILALTRCGALGSSNLPCPIPQELMDKPQEGSVSFTFQNGACPTVCSLYISPSSCDDWGFDWVGYDNVHSGEEIVLQVSPGRYDVMVEDCTQAYGITERVNLTSDESFPWGWAGQATAGSCTASVTVENHSSEPICHMWIGSPSIESFGLNWLGEDQVGSGESFTFYVDPDTYDIKAEGCDWSLMRVELDVPVSDHLVWTVP